MSSKTQRRALARAEALIVSGDIIPEQYDWCITAIEVTPAALSRSTYPIAFALPDLSVDQLLRLIRCAPYRGGLMHLLNHPDVTEDLFAGYVFGPNIERTHLDGNRRRRCTELGWLIPALLVNPDPGVRTATSARRRIRQVRLEFEHDPLALAVFAEVGVAALDSFASVIEVTRILSNWLHDVGSDVDTLRQPSAFVDALNGDEPDANVLTCYISYLLGRYSVLTHADAVALMSYPHWTNDQLIRLSLATFKRFDWAPSLSTLALHPHAEDELVTELFIRLGGHGETEEFEDGLRAGGHLLPTAYTFGGRLPSYSAPFDIRERINDGLELLDYAFKGSLAHNEMLRRAVISLEATWTGDLDDLVGVTYGLIA